MLDAPQHIAAVLKTLFFPFEAGVLDMPVDGQKTLFLNAQPHDVLSDFTPLIAQQYFKPVYDRLQQKGVNVQADISDDGTYDTALVLMPKNQIEARYCFARALCFLRDGGVFVAAAANKEGAGRLVKMLRGFDLADVQTETRNKCRVVWAHKNSLDEDAINAALKDGEVQPVLGGQFISQPGIFGWNKMDQGSQLLLQHLPKNLSGQGADFGCGYGALSAGVLSGDHDIKSLDCIDADWRAVELCKQNLKAHADIVALNFDWSDLRGCTRGLYDFILMNPPFHEGKKTDQDIGKNFIQSAAKSLRAGGRLFMVANRQLGYEAVLNGLFSRVEKHAEANGFKVFEAVK